MKNIPAARDTARPLRADRRMVLSIALLERDIMELVLQFDGRVSYKIVEGKQTIEYNSLETFQSASLIKLPILMEGRRQIDKGLLDPAERITMKDAVRTGGSGVLQSLSDDAVLTVEDLLTLMITVSDNTATNLLIDRIGLEEINQCMTDMGLGQTMLQRRMMDWKAAASGLENITSASDMAECLRLLETPGFLQEQSRKKCLKILKHQQFLDKLPAKMGSKKTYAGKTGSLDTCSHDIGTIWFENHTVHAAILTDQMSSQEESRLLISEIGCLVYNTFS